MYILKMIEPEPNRKPKKNTIWKLTKNQTPIPKHINEQKKHIDKLSIKNNYALSRAGSIRVGYSNSVGYQKI